MTCFCRRAATGARTGWTAAVAATLTVAAPALTFAQSLPEARAAFRSGEYADAIAAYRGILHENPESAEARTGLMRALATLGEYADAIAVGEEATSPTPVASTLGEIRLLTGDVDGAEAAFRQAIDQRARDALVAEADLAELLFATGRVDEAMERFDRFIDVYNAADGRLPSRDLVAVGRALRYLGRGDPDLFHDALRAFDEAASADPGAPEPVLYAGELFLEKYLSTDAQAEFQKVLLRNPKDPRALLGMARALDFDGRAGAAGAIEAVLEINPNHVEARTLLARLHLTREGHDEARAEAERALEVNPRSLGALSALAAAHFQAGDAVGFDRVRSRALSMNPRYAGLDGALAEVAVQTRRYADAVERARAAVELDSASWTAWGLLGMNELRLGQIEEGRAHLERAFTGDPYNPWFKNSLDLLDTFERFQISETEHFELFLHGIESELLAPLVAEIAEEAYDSLSRRYGAEPPVPVRVELFPSHADFSVRTLGEAGLGALGVSFGSVLVMDSPAARQKGEYNWASVLWHELAHTFHLALSEHRVPRWFSEGLAVHEQRRARPGWGHQPSFGFLAALRDGRLKKVSELNDGFMRPDYPEQVIFSYYQASLVFQLLEERHGFGAIRTMLDGYRRGEDTKALFESVLGTTLGDFDGDFDDYLKERFDRPLQGIAKVGEPAPAGAGVDALGEHVRAHPGDLVARLRLGAALIEEDRLDEAETHLREALRIFPEYGGPDSPYWFLAQIHERDGDPGRAAAALARLNGLSESNFAALVKEADLLEQLDRGPDAAFALSRALLVYPYEMELHLRLADLATEVGDHDAAVTARRAVVALDPVDRAEALYRLALAQRDAGDAAVARRTVLRALEVAPNYEEALELLLELRGTSRPDRS